MITSHKIHNWYAGGLGRRGILGKCLDLVGRVAKVSTGTGGLACAGRAGTCTVLAGRVGDAGCVACGMWCGLAWAGIGTVEVRRGASPCGTVCSVARVGPGLGSCGRGRGAQRLVTGSAFQAGRAGPAGLDGLSQSTGLWQVLMDLAGRGGSCWISASLGGYRSS